MTTPADLNAQLCQRLGWTDVFQFEGGYGGVSPDGRAAMRVPNWTTSRDAAHELLQGMTDEQWDVFTTAISEYIEDFLGESPVTSQGHAVRLLLTATPEQICRAWLKATETRE